MWARVCLNGVIKLDFHLPSQNVSLCVRHVKCCSRTETTHFLDSAVSDNDSIDGEKTEKGQQLSQRQICSYPAYNQHYSLIHSRENWLWGSLMIAQLKALI